MSIGDHPVRPFTSCLKFGIVVTSNRLDSTDIAFGGTSQCVFIERIWIAATSWSKEEEEVEDTSWMVSPNRLQGMRRPQGTRGERSRRFRKWRKNITIRFQLRQISVGILCEDFRRRHLRRCCCRMMITARRGRSCERTRMMIILFDWLRPRQIHWWRRGFLSRTVVAAHHASYCA